MINHSTRKGLVTVFSVFFLSIAALSQCPTGNVTGDVTINSGSSPCTISSNLTITGNLTITNSGSLTVSPGVTLTVTETITLKNSSSITATNANVDAGTFSDGSNTNTITGGTYTVGTFTMGGGGSTTISGITVNSSGSISLDDVPTVSNSTFNAATSFAINSGSPNYIFTNVNITAGTTADIQDAAFSNSTMNVGDALTISSGTTSFDNSTINTGTNNAGTNDADALTFNGGGVLTLTNNTQMNVRGSVVNNEWYVDDSDVVVTGDFDNAGNEILEVRNNGTFNVGGNFNNHSGNVSADDGAVVVVEGDYVNTGGGSTDVDGGTFSVGGTYTGGAATGDTGDCGSGGGGCCGGGCAALPVTLIDFTHQVENNLVTLKWRTASEQDNDFFTLERSTDGINFTEVCEVTGAGTSNEMKEYSQKDRVGALADRLYYRLSQTDYDGTFEVLGIISVSFDSFDQQEVTLYPNPAVNTPIVRLSGVSATTHWYIYSLAGELMRSGQVNNSAEVSIEGLKSGTYILKVDGASASNRLIIK